MNYDRDDHSMSCVDDYYMIILSWSSIISITSITSVRVRSASIVRVRSVTEGVSTRIATELQISSPSKGSIQPGIKHLFSTKTAADFARDEQDRKNVSN